MLKAFTIYIVYENGVELFRGNDIKEITRILYEIDFLQHSGRFKDVTIKCLFNPDLTMEFMDEVIDMDLADINVKPQHIEVEKHIEEVRQSIEKRGLIIPLSVDLDNNLLDGHHRYHALKALGVKRIKVLKKSREWYKTMEENIRNG